MNIDITSALFLLKILYKYTQTLWKEGTIDVNIQWRTPIISMGVKITKSNQSNESILSAPLLLIVGRISNVKSKQIGL